MLELVVGGMAGVGGTLLLVTLRALARRRAVLLAPSFEATQQPSSRPRSRERLGSWCSEGAPADATCRIAAVALERPVASVPPPPPIGSPRPRPRFVPSAPPPRRTAPPPPAPSEPPVELGEPVRPEHYSLAPPLPEDDPDPTERTERRSFSFSEEMEVLIGDDELVAEEPIDSGDEDDESSWLRELADLAARRSRRGQDGSVTNEWAITGKRAPLSGPPPDEPLPIDESDDQADTQPLSGTHRLRRERLVG